MDQTPPRPDQDPFDALGVEPVFDLSPTDVARAYRKAAAAAHPDRNPTSGDPARLTAALNRARSTLESDERRANALLARLGGPSKEQDNSLPEGFLMEIMETRMAVEEALANSDPNARARCEAEAESQRQIWVDQVRAAFAALSDPPAASELAAIRTILNAWRYTERLIEQLDPDYNPATADFDR